MSRSQPSSSKTASGKPKAFQFVEGAPAQNSKDDSENTRPRPASQSKRTSQPHTTSLVPVTEEPSASPRNAFPSTPATRLPLAELIGNIDELSSLNTTVQASPEDHIQWHSVRSPRTADGKRMSASQMKRARSSSPPGSSFKTASQKPRITLQTPNLDPAADLWQRYATSSARDGQGTAQNVTLANLMNTSSPRSAVEDKAGTVGGLRRWTSCGVEWPSSKAKRRKTRHTVIREQMEEIFVDSPAPSESLPPIDEAKRQRIGNLIERIQESLVKPLEVPEPQAPSSSSPLPDRSPVIERRSLSPIRPDRQGDGVHDVSLSQQMARNLQIPSPALASRSSSSFGSADLDETMFDEAQPISLHVEKTIDTKSPAVDIQPPVIHPIKTAVKVDACLEDATLVNEDDFDDDIELSDFDADDLDKIALSCDVAQAAANEVKRIPSPPRPKAAFTDLVLDDDFGDDDVDDECFAAAEVAATQSYQAGLSQNPPIPNHDQAHDRTIQRYRVSHVSESEYTTPQGRSAPEKVVLVEDKRGLYHHISLRQSWYDTRCTEGSYVHVIGQFDQQQRCIIDDNHNMLILHPDHLISALVVADSFGCIRRAVLQDRIKATSDPSPPQTYGTMLHEIFQEAMKANRWDADWLNNTIDMIVARHVEDLYAIKLSIPQAVEHLRSKMPELQAWAGVFVQAKPGVNAIVKDRGGKELTMSVNKLLDVEEHIWSPMYGLKGNIDATVQVTMQDETGERTLTVPFEVKTGKNSSSTSHRAQTALYTLLLSDRYDISIVYGVLYYMETSEISRIPAIRQELRHMIMQRNELACYVRERLTLPPMLKTAHTCNRCYAKTSCFMYHKLAEDGDGETSGLQEKFTELVNHLKPTHQDFFKKWDDLLTKEESEMMKFKRELWTMLSTEREKHGRCFANVVLVPGSAAEETNASKINRFKYTFQRREGEDKTFSDSHIVVGEPIVISDEQGHYALANGYVTEIQTKHITVAVDRRLHNARTREAGFDANNNQVFTGIMDVEGLSTAPRRTQADGLLYRLDKDEFSNGLATVRNNLIQIMRDDLFHAKEIRSFVVDNVAPKFKLTSPVYTLSGPASQLSINEDQKAAIEKILTAEDYALVLGMPGTGKTTTIAHIIRALVAKGKSVLLTSYTHTAVDNILLKIRDENIGILRLGAAAKVHPEVSQFAILAAEPKTTIEELEKAYQEPQVVATTCLGINHQVFNERVFDYCIVDEASQITLPICLGPIRMAKTFVLVGDHYQLPPLVQNREAQEGGLDVSLFKLLSERQPDAVVTLRHQYRMNSDIMSISNALVYDGRLICGSPSVATRTLKLLTLDKLSLLHPTSTHPNSSCWLHRCLSPTSPSVIFLNTDALNTASSLSATQTVSGSRITNPLEATLLTHLSLALLLAGLPASSLGIVTPYRSQLRLIRDLLTFALPAPAADHIEAHTADRFQGRDKEVVLMSFVRSNERNIVGELLKDWRRVNVSVTRARSKMVLVGSKRTLREGDELLGRLVSMCEEKGWMVDLTEGMGIDVASHAWESARMAVAVGGGGAGATPMKARKSGTGRSPAKGAKRQPTVITIDEDEAENENDNTSPIKPGTAAATTTTTTTTSSSANRPSSSTISAASATTSSMIQKQKRNFSRVVSNGSSMTQKPFKVPRKVGKVDPGVVVGGAMRKRGVLADIVNEVLSQTE